VADPVSWYLIEVGWDVVSAEGDHLGRVTTVDAEPEIDIFDGIEFRHPLFEHVRYVPSEQVDVIFEGEIRLSLTSEQAQQLPPAR